MVERAQQIEEGPSPQSLEKMPVPERLLAIQMTVDTLRPVISLLDEALQGQATDETERV